MDPKDNSKTPSTPRAELERKDAAAVAALVSAGAAVVSAGAAVYQATQGKKPKK